MKIAFDYQIFTLQAYGGISRYFHQLGHEFTNRKHEVKIFAPYHCNQLIDLLGPSMVVGRRVSQGDFSKAKALAIMLLNQMLAKRAINRWSPSLVHETYFAYRRSAPSKFPVVVTVYDMIHEKFPEYFGKLDPTSFLKKLAINRADQIICISESTKKDLLELFPWVEKKVSVIHLGFSAFSSKKVEPGTHKSYLLYVGSRNGHKNFRGLLAAYVSSKEIHSAFDLVAFGGGRFSAEETELIEEAGLGNRVKQVTGSDDLLASFYKNAAAFIYPSFYEGFGLPPLEAMAQQCPVVSSNTSSMPEVVGDAGELFDPYSVTEMRSAIERVIFSPTKRDWLVERGKARLAEFSWVKCAAQTEQVYRTALK